MKFVTSVNSAATVWGLIKLLEVSVHVLVLHSLSHSLSFEAKNIDFYHPPSHLYVRVGSL